MEKQREMSITVIRYGTSEQPPAQVPLRAGPFSLLLEQGDLRNISLDGELVVLRLYGAVRDRNWDTIEPRFVSYDVDERPDGFEVWFTAECVSDDVDFAWEGHFSGTSDGRITAVFDGVARRGFWRNRIGWCLLHPMGLAGRPVETVTPEGSVQGAFPIAISPTQPFFDLQAISYPTTSGKTVTIHFEGDLFEMEDQRNWTDASYKTYSTPLREPYPVEIQQGQRVTQIITIDLASGPGVGVGARSGDETERAILVQVGDQVVGQMPAIGLGLASHGQALSEEERRLLRDLGPSHLRALLNLAAEGWQVALEVALGEARNLEVPLELEIMVGEQSEELQSLFCTIVDANVPLARVLVFPVSGYTTTTDVMGQAVLKADLAGIDAPLGGGSRADFTELNRAADSLPLGAMDVIGYSINPQVHAFDNESLMETIRAQAETVKSAQAIAPDKAIVVGPITLKPRFNPNATGPAPEVASGTLPPSVDVRQAALIGAAWTAGSLASLGRSGATSLTYFETTGWRGVVERSDHPLRVTAFPSRPGMIFPLYHVLAGASRMVGNEVLETAVSEPGAIETLAVRMGDEVAVIVSNLHNAETRVELILPVSGTGSVQTLDETTFEQATSAPALFHAARQAIDLADGKVEATLLPYGVMFILTSGETPAPSDP